MPENPKKVIIIGGGIAGCVLALALDKIGMKSEIFEARKIPKDDVGLFHYLSSNAMNVYKVLGLYDKLKDSGHLCNGVIHYKDNGKQLARIDEKNSLQDYGANSIMIKREFLTKILRDEVLSKQIPIHFGKKINDITNIGKQNITAHFEDGTNTEGDLIVGCDGIYSKTRRIIMPNSPKPYYTKMVVTGGYTKTKITGKELNIIHSNYGKKGFLAYFVMPDSDDVWWWNGVSYPKEETRENIEKLSNEKWQQAMIEMYSEDSSIVQEIIKSKDINFFKFPISDMLLIDTWYKQNVCLIGDAVHATSPTNGQGAAMASEDGLLLAKCLRDIEDYEQAFEKFQQLRQKRVEKIVKIGRSTGEGYLMTNPVRKWLRNTMIVLMINSPFFGKMKDFFFGYDIQWDRKIK